LKQTSKIKPKKENKKITGKQTKSKNYKRKKKKEIVKHIRRGNFNAITSPLARNISHGLAITSSS